MNKWLFSGLVVVDSLLLTQPHVSTCSKKGNPVVRPANAHSSWSNLLKNRGKLHFLPPCSDLQSKKSQNWSLYDATYTSWVKTKIRCLDWNADFPWYECSNGTKGLYFWNYKRKQGQWKSIFPSLLLCWNDIWEKERSSDIFDLKWCNPDELPKIHWNFKASNVNVSTIK